MKVDIFKKWCILIQDANHEGLVSFLDDDNRRIVVYEADSGLSPTLDGAHIMAEDQAKENHESRLGCINCALLVLCQPESSFFFTVTNDQSVIYPAQYPQLILEE